MNVKYPGLTPEQAAQVDQSIARSNSQNRPRGLHTEPQASKWLVSSMKDSQMSIELASSDPQGHAQAQVDHDADTEAESLINADGPDHFTRSDIALLLTMLGDIADSLGVLAEAVEAAQSVAVAPPPATLPPGARVRPRR